MPVNTIRAWTIGLIWAIILPGMNQFFFFRLPGITVTGVSATSPPMPRVTPTDGRTDCRAIAIVPNGSPLGHLYAQGQDIWHVPQPWAIHGQRTCHHHPHG